MHVHMLAQGCLLFTLSMYCLMHLCHDSLFLIAISSVAITAQYRFKSIIFLDWREKNYILSACDIFMYKFENH